MGPPGVPSDPRTPPPPGPILLEWESDAGDGVIVVRLLARSLEWQTAEALGRELSDLADRLDRGAGVILNLDGIRRIDAAVLGRFVRLWKRVEHDLGGALSCCEPSPELAELFRICRLPWPVYPTQEEAIDALRASAPARRPAVGDDGDPS